MIKTYLFDLDGTIIDTKVYREIYEPLIKLIQEKRKATRDEIIQFAEEKKITQSKTGRFDTGELAKAYDILDDYYKILSKHIKENPVIREEAMKAFIELKKRKKRIGIVTNSMKRTIEMYVEIYKLTEYIDFVFSGKDIGMNKNDIKFWQKLVKEYKLKPNECMMIGDNEEDDVKNPLILGMKTLLIRESKDLELALKQV